jgi:hypothetical protein
MIIFSFSIEQMNRIAYFLANYHIVQLKLKTHVFYMGFYILLPTKLLFKSKNEMCS